MPTMFAAMAVQPVVSPMLPVRSSRAPARQVRGNVRFVHPKVFVAAIEPISSQDPSPGSSVRTIVGANHSVRGTGA